LYVVLCGFSKPSIFYFTHNLQPIILATILFKFEDKNLQPVEIQALKGDTILDIAENNGVHLNHNCGGVCACSTCHVYVDSPEADAFPESSDREEDFVDRAINPRLNSRLACQCQLLKSDKNLRIEVLVPDQSRIIGHEH
jgi:2Fe-2S ferredoxin